MSTGDEIRRELLDEFGRVARERIERISTGWIALEKRPADAALAESLARELHTLKGESKMMGLGDISLMAHRLEDLVLLAKRRGFMAPAQFGDILLRGLDETLALVDKQVGGTDDPVDISAVMATIDCLAEELEIETGAGAAVPASVPDDAEAAAPEDMQVPALPTGAAVEAANAAIGPGASARLERARSRELLAVQVPEERFLRVGAELVSAFSESASETVVNHSRYERVVAELQQLGVDLAAALSASRGEASGAGPAPLRSLQERLDDAVELLQQRVDEGAAQARELDYRARQLRLVPIAALFSKYARPVRDLAREHGKLIDVESRDNEVALDKSIVDRLAEPILHLIRNAVDHGIESPADRQAKGKPQAAKVILSAHRQGAIVTVTVSDDGRGVSWDHVRRRAVDMGFAEASTAEGLCEEELCAFLFKAGFSTRAQVNETSGRGVGLDVVRRAVGALGGTIRLESALGRGTQFVLTVPIEVTLTRVLVLRSHGQVLALPASSVAAVIAADEARTEIVNGEPMVRFEGRPIPLAQLAAILGSTQPVGPGARLLIIEHGINAVATGVSEVVGELDVILRPLGSVFRDVQLVSGSCVLENGSLALALNPAALVLAVCGGRYKLAVSAPDDAQQAVRHRILLADDSTITRAMLARILTALGYHVEEAEDGEQALAVLEATSVNLVLTDLEMPNVDGLELTRRIRANPSWRGLPVVVISTRGSVEDKGRALDAGADAYIVKMEFSEATLRETIARSLGGAVR